MKTVTYSVILQITSLVIAIVGVFLISCSSFEDETTRTSSDHISTCSVNCGFKDSQGNLWFGTNKAGVFKYDGTAYQNYKLTGDCSNRVSCISEDEHGNLWFGTTDGLCKYDGQEFNHIPIPWSDTTGIWLDEVYPIVNPNEVRSILIDSKGTVWAGTNGNGVYRYDGASFSAFLQKKGRKQVDGLHHNIISSIVEDADGTIWFTSMTHGGVVSYDGRQFKDVGVDQGLSDDMVLSSFVDKEGKVWFGSLGNRKGGLDCYDSKQGTFKTYREENGLCSNNVTSLFQDEGGLIWIGSQRGNLCGYDGSSFTSFRTETGQTLNGVNFILQDDSGEMWFGVNYGHLYRYDGKKLIDQMSKDG